MYKTWLFNFFQEFIEYFYFNCIYVVEKLKNIQKFGMRQNESSKQLIKD